MALIAIDSSSGKELNELWHRRIAHLHHGALKMLRETVPRVPKLGTEHDDVCRGCVLGKYAKATFPRSDNREEGVLGCIHLYNQIFVAQCPLELSVEPNILSPLLMTIPGKHGSTS